MPHFSPSDSANLAGYPAANMMEKINDSKGWSKRKQVIYAESSAAIKRRSKDVGLYLWDMSHYNDMLDTLYFSEAFLMNRRYLRLLTITTELLAPIGEKFGAKIDPSLENNHSVHEFWSGVHSPDYQLPTELNLFANMLVEMSEARRNAVMDLVHNYPCVEQSKLDSVVIVKERIHEHIVQEGAPKNNRNKYTINGKGRNLADAIDKIMARPMPSYDAEIEELAVKNEKMKNYTIIDINANSILAMALMTEMPLDYYVARDYVTRTADCAHYKDAAGELHRLSKTPWLVQDCADYLNLNRDDQAMILPQVVQMYYA